VCCSVLQCVAACRVCCKVRCNVQCIALCIAVYCSVLPCEPSPQSSQVSSIHGSAVECFARYNLDPESFFVNRFWGRRPDGVAINEALKIVCILEFKRSTDRDEGFLEVKDAEAAQKYHRCAQSCCSGVGI